MGDIQVLPWDFLPKLVLWYDPIARSGAECMAVDEAMAELSDIAVLRVYHWGEPTITYGYFDKEATAKSFYTGDELTYVRRWTGGGIVDHREDVPFTLALRFPQGTNRSSITSALLYRWIHGTLVRVLRDHGVECVMLAEDAPGGGRSCFISPVASDIVDESGVKLVGGGQRRTRIGVVHQGSMQRCDLPEDWADSWLPRLAHAYEITREAEPFPGLNERVAELMKSRYLHPDWPNR